MDKFMHLTYHIAFNPSYTALMKLLRTLSLSTNVLAIFLWKNIVYVYFSILDSESLSQAIF